MSIREQIVAAAVAALGTGLPAGVPAPVRTRIDSPSPDQLPAFTVYQRVENSGTMRKEDPQGRRTRRGPVVKRELFLNVEVLTRAGSGDEPDKRADPILVWATKALAAAGDFGGLANDPADELQTKFEYERNETAFCRATMTFSIEYQTRADDAEQVV